MLHVTEESQVRRGCTESVENCRGDESVGVVCAITEKSMTGCTGMSSMQEKWG